MPDSTIIQHPNEARLPTMTSVIRMLLNTFHPATGSVRAGEVVEVPHELGDHWTNNNIAEDATGQEVTRHTATEAPTGQDGPNEFGQWPEPRPLGEPDPAPAPGAGPYSAMTSRRDVGLAPPAVAAAEPATAEGEPTVAEPTSGPMTGENAEQPPVPVTEEGQPTVAEPTSGPMTPASDPTPEAVAAPEPAPAPETPPA